MSKDRSRPPSKPPASAPPAGDAHESPTQPPPRHFDEVRRLSSGPPAELHPSSRQEPATLPAPHVAPRLLVAADDLAWFELDDVGRQIIDLIDGARTIVQIARAASLPLVQAQVAIAALRERGLVGVR